MFRLPARQGSVRVDVWRRLRRAGAIAIAGSGYVLPNTPETQERFEWLAVSIRRHKGEASVLTVDTIDNLPDSRLRHMFVSARTREYDAVERDVKKLAAARRPVPGVVSRLRRRLRDIAAIDYFGSPLRARVEARLERIASGGSPAPPRPKMRGRSGYQSRLWVTRPRPGIDRVSSAWLIKRVIDPAATFGFLAADGSVPVGAVPFDTFLPDGFGHQGDDCTFETLCQAFAIRDARISSIAQIVHDADLGDEKFGRTEGAGLDRVLVGWAEQGLTDAELLRRGMELIDGLHQSLPESSRDR